MKFLVHPAPIQPTTKAIRSGGIKQLTSENFNTLDPHYLITSHPNIRIFCDCCRKHITLETFIITDQNQFCVTCFAKFQQFPQNYNVFSKISYCLTDQNWMSLDQLLLLNGFQKWGFGNWGQVKHYMGYNGANFNKDELRNHYDKYYLENQSMLPSLLEDYFDKTRNNQHILEIRKIQIQQKINQAVKPSQQRSEQQIKKTSQQEQKTSSNTIKQPNILGYNSKRQSFLYDLDYDDKAQCLLSDLQFRDDDTPQQVQLKFKIIQNFNIRQSQRLKRYKFTLQHHILDIDYRFKQQISVNKYQKQAFNSFKKFTRFQTHEQNQQTRSLIANCNYLKSMIQGLKKCRKKLDKYGRIQNTLQELRKRDSSLEGLGAPRKRFQIDMSQQKQVTQEQIIKNLQKTLGSLKKGGSKEMSPNLSITYRSPKAILTLQNNSN